MKKIILFLFLFTTAWTSAETRTWTSTTGTTVEAELMEFANRTVVLKTAGGRKLTLSLDKLVPEDRVRIKEWAEGQKHVQAKTQSARNSATGTDNQSTLKGGLADLLPENLLDSHGKEVSRNKLAGKTVGFYFSAHWCPPCRTFTPNLVKFRDDHKDDFEIVFVSSDRSPQAQMGYMEEANMKWLTLPHRGKAANSLAGKYGVKGIPALIIVSPDGETITKNGRGDVSGNPKGALAKWTKSSTSTPTATADSSDRKKNAGGSDSKWLTNLDDALKEAKESDKTVLVNFTGSDWCGWCIRLKKEVFSQDDFKDWAKENVVLLEADFPRGKPTLGDAKEIKKRLGGDVRGYPTILFLDAEGKVKGKSGYMKGGPESWVKNAEKFTGS
jgi:thiol-disulfide isomerase/thioredoxin